MDESRGGERRHVRALLLEDDRSDAELSLRKLREAGYEVEADIVSDSAGFMEQVKAKPYDVILGDYRLPAWTGAEAVCWLRAAGYTTPFILVYGTVGDELAVECIKKGVTDYVLKNNLDRLPMALSRALAEDAMRVDRDRAEKELRETSEQYRSIVDDAPHGIGSMDEDGRLLMANPALLAMLGYEKLDGLSLTNDLFCNPAERAVALLGEPPGGVHTEVRWRRKDGKEIIVRLARRRHASRFRGAGVYEIFVEDITETRTLEREFYQAQKLEAVGRLAGGVAHDFNNLLTVISGCAELIQSQNNPARIADHVRQILRASNMAASLVSQLLAFSRKQAPARHVLELNEVISDLKKMLPRLLGEDVEVAVDLRATHGRICVDRGQLEQIVMNLAVNARDAMPDGGRLNISTFDLDLNADGQKNGRSKMPVGSYAVLCVGDTGTGMTGEVQSHLFEPFFTTKEMGKGTGLGLATVYGIVKQSGGYISVASEAGKGSTFSIYFPCAAARPVSAPVRHEPQVPTGGHETILLVEDEGALRDITCEYLESQSYTVLTAAHAAAALEICANYHGEIRLLVTDVIMPGMAGPELAKAVLALQPEMRVIFVSGYTDRAEELATSGGGSKFLRKPYSLSDLGQVVRASCGEVARKSA